MGRLGPNRTGQPEGVKPILVERCEAAVRSAGLPKGVATKLDNNRDRR
jgi:hypothetical protein